MNLSILNQAQLAQDAMNALSEKQNALHKYAQIGKQVEEQLRQKAIDDKIKQIALVAHNAGIEKGLSHGYEQGAMDGMKYIISKIEPQSVLHGGSNVGLAAYNK